MGYTNSALTDYVRISPNRTPNRTHAIDTITIHCVVGQCTVEELGEIFAPSSRQASSNYGVGYDGRVGMYVEEKDRSWCSSNAANDHRAITIEVASDTEEPYGVRPAAYDKLIELAADICRRNGIKRLVWSNDKNTRVNHLNGSNMTVHRDYADKSCPGTWLYTRMGQIAAAVNSRLGAGDGPAAGPAQSYGADVTVGVHLLQVGSFGPLVSTLQRILYAQGLLSDAGEIDGRFGAKTRTAVLALQRQLGVDADGIVGVRTWQAMLTEME